MQSQEPIDAETLAALMDGRLSEEKASEVRARLTNADFATIDAYMDAVKIANDLAAEDASPFSAQPTNNEQAFKVHSDFGIAGTTTRTSKRGRGRPALWSVPFALAAAASLFVLTRTRNQHVHIAPADYSIGQRQELTSSASEVWGADRGGNGTESDRKTAARVGALLADFEIASGESAKAVARSLSNLLNTAAGGPLVARFYEQIAEGSSNAPSDLARRASGANALRIMDDRYSAAGVYLESCRLAAKGGFASFFERPQPEQIADLIHDKESQSDVRNQVEAAVGVLTKPNRDFAVLGNACTDALRAITQ